MSSGVHITSPPTSGDVMWLPRPDPTNSLDERMLNHPVVVLYTLPNGMCWFLMMTSFQGQSIERRFSGKNEYNKNRRKKYIPVHPTAPHPDTNECIFPIVTGTPVTTKKETTSYIKLEDPVLADYHVLGDLWKGTMRLNDKDLNRLRVLAKSLAPLDIRRQLKQAHKKDKGPVIIKQPVVASIPKPVVAPALPKALLQAPKPLILRPPENAPKSSNLYRQQSYVPPKVSTRPSTIYIPTPLSAPEHKPLIPRQSSQSSHTQYGTIGGIHQPSRFPRDVESQRSTTSRNYSVHKQSILLTIVEGFAECIFSVILGLLKFIWCIICFIGSVLWVLGQEPQGLFLVLALVVWLGRIIYYVVQNL